MIYVYTCTRRACLAVKFVRFSFTTAAVGDARTLARGHTYIHNHTTYTLLCMIYVSVSCTKRVRCAAGEKLSFEL